MELVAAPEGGFHNTEQLQGEVGRVCFDERFYFQHKYEQGDIVFVNNYTTLHGRNAFTGGRELWPAT